MSTDKEELPSIFDASTCVRKGLCPVTTIRNKGDPFESHSLYYEQHGNGPEKILFIMGLNNSSFGWYAQVAHFGRHPDYSVLVFDNRGVGNSGVPMGPYTTSGMAEDAITLLDYIGWTEKRDLHVVGISLGGMIAQELATRIPERVVSLVLAVTTPGGRPWTNLPPRKGFMSLARLMTITDVEIKIPIMHDMLFPQAWLEAKAEGDPKGRTNREVQTELYRHRIATTRPQTLLGSLSQMTAALTHYVSPARLRSLSLSLPPSPSLPSSLPSPSSHSQLQPHPLPPTSIPKIVILTGDEDNLVHPSNSAYMKAHMPEAEFVTWEGTGHGIHVQCVKRFNELVERAVGEGRARVG